MTAAQLQICMRVLNITLVQDSAFNSPFPIKKILPIKSPRKYLETVVLRFLIPLLLVVVLEISGIHPREKLGVNTAKSPRKYMYAPKIDLRRSPSRAYVSTPLPYSMLAPAPPSRARLRTEITSELYQRGRSTGWVLP